MSAVVYNDVISVPLGMKRYLVVSWSHCGTAVFLVRSLHWLMVGFCRKFNTVSRYIYPGVWTACC